ENHSLPDLQRPLQGSLCVVQGRPWWRAVFHVLCRGAGGRRHAQGRRPDHAHLPDRGQFQPDGFRLPARPAVSPAARRVGFPQRRQRGRGRTAVQWLECRWHRADALGEDLLGGTFCHVRRPFRDCLDGQLRGGI
ncbi:PhnB protein; putative DNA binding 3-demethylubiquinone-9 3-methyltransferase domain protein, partial [Pseudomonas sp. FG-3G]